MSKNENNKAILGHVTLKNGDVLTVYMPKMSEIMPSFTGSGTHWIINAIIGGTEKPLEWFHNLDLDDGAKVLATLQPAIAAVTTAFEAVAAKPTKH